MVQPLFEEIRHLDREVRRLRSRLDAVTVGTELNPSSFAGVIPPASGGSGTGGSPLGVTLWQNQSGAIRSQGVVVVENGNRTFGVTATQANPLVIGVLDDNAIAVGANGRVRHVGYQSAVTVQGAVVAGQYLRTSTTSGAAEDAGTIMTSGCFAIALTAAAGPGAGTVSAYLLPHPLGSRLNILGDGNAGTPDLFFNGSGGFGYTAGQVRVYGPSNGYIGHWDDSALVIAINTRVGTWLRVGSTAAPNNQTTGDLTTVRAVIGDDTPIGAVTRSLWLNGTWNPVGTVELNLGHVSVVLTPNAAGLVSDEHRAMIVAVAVAPTAAWDGQAIGTRYEVTHDSGAFNVGRMYGFWGEVRQGVAGTTLAIGRGAHVVYRALAGTITEAAGLLVTRGVAGDAGAITTAYGVRILASAGVAPTTDIALSVEGAVGHSRFQGAVVIGALASPAAATVGLYLTQLMAQSGTSIAVGVDGTAPQLVLAAMDGVNEGGQMTLNGAAANTDWTWDNSAGTLRWIGSGVNLLLATAGLRVAGYLRIGSTSAPTNVGAGDLTMAGKLTATPSAAQNVTAVGYTILANATVVQLTADASYSLTSAPTIADGQDGQMLLIVNVDTVDVITLQDQGTLAGSNLRLSAVGIALGPRDSILLMYSSTVGDWIQIGQTNVI